MKKAYLSFSIFVFLFLLFSIPAIADEKDRILARITTEEDVDEIELEGCTITHRLTDATSFECSVEVADRLDLEREDIEEDQIFWILDLQADQQIKADQVWALGYKGSGVTVAVLDTGIDLNHPELISSIVGGKSFVSYTTSFADDHGHGTHVSGIITADGINSNAKGAAPEAGVWMGKVCNSGGSCFVSDISAAIEFVVLGQDGLVNTGDEPAKIMSISLGGGGTSSSNCDGDFLASKVNWAVDNGVTVAAAAGNRGDRVSSPACASKAIAVGAVNKNDVRPSWSGSGKALDIVAPGVSILSTLPGGYGFASGTSMSAPHVSAVITLLRQVSSSLTDAQIKNALYTTAKDLGSAGWDKYFGWGRVDALAAFQSILPPTPIHDVAVTSILAPSSVTQGDITNIQVIVANEGTVAETFTVSLTDTTDNVIIGSQPISLAAGGSQVLTFNWNTATSSAGSHTLKAEASVVTGETDTADNVKTANVQVNVPDTQAPTAPSNLVATVVSSSRIDISWTASTDNVGVTGYRVYRNGALVATVSGTSYSDTGLSASTTYSYYVTAIDAANNESPPSNTVTATTLEQQSQLSVTIDAPSTVTVGDRFRLRAHVTNTGTTTVTDVIATLILPEGLTTSNSLTKSLGSIDVSETTSTSWRIRADIVGTYTIIVNVVDSTGASASGSTSISVTSEGSGD